MVAIDRTFKRPTDVDVLIGDSTKAREKLGWKPTVHFSELINIMIMHDLALAKREKLDHSFLRSCQNTFAVNKELV